MYKKSSERKNGLGNSALLRLTSIQAQETGDT